MKRTKIIFRKEEWDKIKQYDEENTKFIYPFNDGIHIDSIIDFEKLEFAIPEVSENASSIEDKQTLQNYSPKDFEDIKNMYLLIFHDVIISKGRNQSILYDLSEKRLFKVPNSVIEFITILGNKTIGEILNSFSKNEKTILFSYVQFLLSNKLARLVTKVEQFGTQEQFINGFKDSLNISTSIIDSTIIDVKETSSFDIQGFIKK